MSGLSGAASPALHRVDEITADLIHLRLSQRAAQQIDPGRGHQRALPAGEHLDALGTGIRPLIVLAGQRFYRQAAVRAGNLGQSFLIKIIYLGLGKYGGHGGAVLDLGDTFGVIPIEHPDPLSPAMPRRPLSSRRRRSPSSERPLLFHITAINLTHFHRPLSGELYNLYIFYCNLCWADPQGEGGKNNL